MVKFVTETGGKSQSSTLAYIWLKRSPIRKGGGGWVKMGWDVMKC